MGGSLTIKYIEVYNPGLITYNVGYCVYKRVVFKPPGARLKAHGTSERDFGFRIADLRRHGAWGIWKLKDEQFADEN